MKKYILSIVITLSLVCSVPSFAGAVEKDLSISDIKTIINVLISIGVIPQNKVATVNAFLAVLESTAVNVPSPIISTTTPPVIPPAVIPPVSNNTNTTTITLTPLGGGGIVSGSGSPYLSSGSANSQLVSEQTSSVIAYYNFTAQYGPAIIKEMYFTITGSSVAGNEAPITSVIVGGVSVPVVGTLATLAGLNITIPIGNAGYNIPVAVTFAKVGTGGISSGKTAGLILTGYRYSSGITDNTVNSLSVPSNLMTVVGSKPTLSISNPISTSVGSGGTVEIARITVSADSAGSIKINEIPLSMIVSGNGLADTLSVKVASSNVSLTSGGTISVGTTTATTSLVILGGYNISAGSSVTFSIYANTSLTQQNRTSDTLRTSLGDKTFFVWTDVNGGTQIDGSMIYNYPTNTAAVSY